MNKFKELLFFKQLKGFGNVTINKKYSSVIKDVNGIDDCISLVKKYETKYTDMDIEQAKYNAEEKYLNIMNNKEISVITIYDPEYPERLNDLKDKRPLILYIRGNKHVLNDKNIAVVGTREPSEWSKKVERQLVERIIQGTERVIVSGLALGCDQVAHQTTIDYNGKTIAVLPSGINVITPASHKSLADSILTTGGCLLSEYEPDEKATKSRYVERDLIVAAFSEATLVIQCGVKSGTMHTVDAAFDLRRNIACFYPNKDMLRDYTGNEYMVKAKGASKLSNTEDLNEFLAKIGECGKSNEPNMQQLSLFDNFLETKRG